MSQVGTAARALSLYRLLDPAVVADPYPLYARLREDDPVHWDPFLHTWIATRYDDVATVLHQYSANRTPSPEQLAALGMDAFRPVAEVMVRQMLYLDPPQHTRVRVLAANVFTPRRVDTYHDYVATVVDALLDAVHASRQLDVVADLARPLPAIVACEMLGVPVDDWPQLSTWTRSFAELLGNFQHDPVRASTVRDTVDGMTEYFRGAIHERPQRADGLLHAFTNAVVDGDRLDENEVVANAMLTLVGGLETTTNLIANGLASLLAHPEQWAALRADPSLVPSAVEELLRFESPIQHTARLAPDDTELGGKPIRKRQAVTAVLAAANRDPARFPQPDRLDICRADNRHLAFGWSTHHCFGAPLARLVAQRAFDGVLERMPGIRMTTSTLHWRRNGGAFRGLESLPVEF